MGKKLNVFSSKSEIFLAMDLLNNNSRSKNSNSYTIPFI